LRLFKHLAVVLAVFILAMPLVVMAALVEGEVNSEELRT
jgi:hypothetical protein